MSGLLGAPPPLRNTIKPSFWNNPRLLQNVAVAPNDDQTGFGVCELTWVENRLLGLGVELSFRAADLEG